MTDSYTTVGDVTQASPLLVRPRNDRTGQPATPGEAAPSSYTVGDVVAVLVDGGRVWVLDRLVAA